MNGIQELRLDVEKEIPKREIPKDLPSLSVFEYPYTWKSWSGFWHNIVYFFRCWRPAWHRATKGFCRADTWNVDYSVTVYLIKVLTEYRNITNGYPGNKDFPTFESWIEAIDQCIDWLIFSVEEPDKLNKYWPEYEKFSHKGTKNWTEEEHRIFDEYYKDSGRVYKMQCEARKKAFAFLGEYLPHIWW